MLATAVAAIFTVLVGLSWTLKAHVKPAAPLLQSDAVALNMLVFDRAAAQFAVDTPSFEGEITPSNLSLPAWYVNMGNWRSEVKAGFMVTYKTSPTRFSPDLVAALMNHTDAQMMVGKFSSDEPGFAVFSPCFGLRTPLGICPISQEFATILGRRASKDSPIVLRKVHS